MDQQRGAKIGVMMQYARDYQAMNQADRALHVLFNYLDEKQDEATGLFGADFDLPQDLSHGVQAGYHFWLLYFYDRRPVRHAERIVDSILATQSLSGGFGVKWNSSACEDIDSIDPLVRLRWQTDYRARDVEAALQRAFSGVTRNLNPEYGGRVFRRDEAMNYGFSLHTYSGVNQSNLFFTWFRTLGLALLTEGLGDERAKKQLGTQWKRVPGLQFPL